MSTFLAIIALGLVSVWFLYLGFIIAEHKYKLEKKINDR